MNRQDYEYKASDGKVLAMSRWDTSDTTPRGIVQIVHGKAEHRKRYDEFAAFLAEKGFTVIANDHRGHGETIEKPEEKGSFGCEEGWSRAVKDLQELKARIKEEYPDTPHFLLGQSMGSFMVQHLIMEDPEGTAGAILMTTGVKPGFLGLIGSLLSQWVGRRRGFETPSEFLENLGTGRYNKPFRPNRTSADWLSRDLKVVDDYIKDPLCGFPGTPSFFIEILKGLTIICDQERVNLLPPNLPIFLVSGDQDPQGNFTKDVKKTYNQYKKAGLTDLTMKFYPGGRHEPLHEINKEEVFEDLLKWMEGHL